MSKSYLFNCINKHLSQNVYKSDRFASRGLVPLTQLYFFRLQLLFEIVQVSFFFIRDASKVRHVRPFIDEKTLTVLIAHFALQFPFCIRNSGPSDPKDF